MDTETVARLKAINDAFYAASADEFDQTRGQAWAGWERLLPHLRLPLSVLDAGCGNGRFGRFLHDRLAPTSPTQLAYRGLDNNPALLGHARTALAACPNLTSSLVLQDILAAPPAGQYDLVTLFGVLHHVPGQEGRHRLLHQLAACVKPGGLLVFTTWRFLEIERLRARVVPWPDSWVVEPGDYLLDWRRGQRTLRYCHAVDDAEEEALVYTTGLRSLAAFRADGEGGRANTYRLLQKSL